MVDKVLKKRRTVSSYIIAVLAFAAAFALVFTSHTIGVTAASSQLQLADIVSVSAGANYSEALTKTGDVYVRGLNNLGQLGLGDLNNRTDWTKVPLDEKIVKISSPYENTIALSDKGTIYTWGDNQYGIAGNGSTGLMVSPVKVTASYHFSSISGGQDFVAALTSGGKLFTWGSNASGQLGTGDNVSTTGPTYVPTSVPFTQVKAGKNFVLALDSNGHLWSWGNNAHGQLGLGSTNNVSTPTQVSGATFSALIAGLTSETAGAIDTSGHLYMWGDNSYGQVGYGPDWRQQQIDANNNVQGQITAINQADAQRKQDLINQCVADKVATWRIANPSPVASPGPTGTPTATATPVATGTPTPTPSSAPTPPDYTAACTTSVTATFQPTDVSGLKASTITEPALKTDALSPVLVKGTVKFSSGATGSQNSYALDTSGTLYAWGADSNGQTALGLDPTITTHSQAPVTTSSTQTFSSVTAGDRWAAAIGNDGNLYSWGLNTDNSLGDSAANIITPQVIGSGYTTVTAGVHSGFVTASDGTVSSWGSGTDKTLGTSSTSSRTSIQKISDISSSRLAITNHAVVALDASGRPAHWGVNTDGVFGDNTAKGSTVQLTPVTPVVSKFKDVAAGRLFVTAVDNSGTVWSWGFNALKAAGVLATSGDAVTYPTIVPVVGNVKFVGADQVRAFAVTEKNVLNIWGNDSTQITAIKVNANIKQVVTGLRQIVMLDDTGHIWNWGSKTLAVQGNFTGTEQLVEADPNNTYTAIGGAGQRTFAVRTNGQLVGWGDPSNIMFLSNQTSGGIIKANTTKKFVSISGTVNNVLAVDSNGVIYGWGSEPYGTFGNYSGIVKTPTVLPIYVGGN